MHPAKFNSMPHQHQQQQQQQQQHHHNNNNNNTNHLNSSSTSTLGGGGVNGNASMTSFQQHQSQSQGGNVNNANNANSNSQTNISNNNNNNNNNSNSNSTPPQIDAEETDKVVGYGAFGVVWSVTDPRSGRRVALKKMPNVFQTVVSAKRVFREVKMLCNLKHDNVSLDRLTLSFFGLLEHKKRNRGENKRIIY